MINININLSRIDKTKIYVGKDGNKYVNLILCKRKEADKFGNTHFLAMPKDKENKDAQTIFVGSGKEYVYKSEVTEDVLGFKKPEIVPVPKPTMEDAVNFEIPDDLPF